MSKNEIFNESALENIARYNRDRSDKIGNEEKVVAPWLDLDVISGDDDELDMIEDAFLEFINAGRDNQRMMNTGLTRDEEKELEDKLLEAKENLLNFMGDKKYLLFDTKKYKYETLSEDRIEKLYEGFLELPKFREVFEDGGGSDKYLYHDPKGIERVFKGRFIISRIKTKRNNGAYFKYTHDTPYDLRCLQIINKKDSKDVHDQVNKNHCLINAISKSVKERDYRVDRFLSDVKLKIGKCQFKTSDFKNILPNWLEIKVTKFNDDMTRRGKIYTYRSKDNIKNKGTLTEVKAKIFLFKEHYMPQIMIKGGLECVNDPSKYDPKKENKATIVIRKILEANKFKYCSFNVSNGLDLIDEEMKNIEFEQEVYNYTPPVVNENAPRVFKVYADFEAIVHHEADKNKPDLDNMKEEDVKKYESERKVVERHLPFMLGAVDEENKYYHCSAVSIGDLIENSLIQILFNKLISTNPSIKYFKVYFHNLKYDFSFIKHNKYITIINELERSGQIYNIKILYKGKNFSLLDSYKVIPEPLSKFASMLDLKDIKKMEFNFYKLIDKENFTKNYIPLEVLEKNLLEREGVNYKDYNDSNNPFKKYISKSSRGFIYSHLRHYSAYLKDDCLTLKAGMEKFDELITTVTGLSTYDSITISAISLKYLQKEGGLDGTVRITGNLQKFLAKATTGGRVCLKDNSKVIVNKPIMDFDGVSLYPSSMARVVIPIGKCEMIGTYDYDQLRELYTDFTVKCRIKINKYQQIPMVSYKEDLVRKWTNDIKEDTYIYLDKNTLEDLIEFQKAEILEINIGVGWLKSNGVNNKINNIITHLFEARLKAKSEGNIAMSNVLKLIMNSMYGKTLLADAEYEIKYIRGEEKFNSYIINNYHKIQVVKQLDQKIDENTRYRIKHRKAA